MANGSFVMARSSKKADYSGMRYSGGGFSRPRRPQKVVFAKTKKGGECVYGFAYKKGVYVTFVGCPAKSGKTVITSPSGKTFNKWVMTLRFPNEFREVTCTGFLGEKNGYNYIVIPEYNMTIAAKNNTVSF